MERRQEGYTPYDEQRNNEMSYATPTSTSSIHQPDSERGEGSRIQDRFDK